ncbi:DUF1566 domain-containing protein [candidate division KSB1 bacterium]|nr:DUF1566 domain-containing protein [candidate division KSB1 bacterium]
MPSNNDKLCFVLMPFRNDLRTVYTEAIKTACDKAGFKAVRADELIGPFNIHRDIIEYIFSSDAIIADLTDWNPNVFYELGVAHAIANKTIMIVQKGQELPFDIHNYRCIAYDLSEPGLRALAYQVGEYLEHLEAWSKRPTNPVQEFKRDHVFIAPEEVKKLRRELQRKEAQLKASVPKAELEKVQRELRAHMKNSVAKTEWEALQKQLQTKIAENIGLEQENARLQSEVKPAPQTRAAKPDKAKRLRDQPKKLSLEEVKAMLAKEGFYDDRWNKDGKGIIHQYETKKLGDGAVVLDHATGLMWQQSGSPNAVTYAAAESYVREKNNERFAGFNDWRLPTLEEAMSLMEREKKNGALYIDPVFDRTQQWIWTADRYSESSCWVAYFFNGGCNDRLVFNYFYVRLVR